MTIKLFNIKMSENGQDRLYFNSKAERDSAFSSGYVSKKCSPYKRLNSLDFEIIVYESANNLDYNYCMYNDYYCFISGIREQTEDQTILQLRLDVITQYCYGTNLDDTKEVFVKRAHIDRFKEIDTDVYQYDFDNEDLLLKEDINIEPSVYSSNSIFFGTQHNQNAKWLAIVKPTPSNEGVSLNDRAKVESYVNGSKVSNSAYATNFTTFLLPLTTEEIKLSDTITTSISHILSIIDTTDIVDCAILPYLDDTDIDLSISGYETTVSFSASDASIAKLVDSDEDSYMLCRLLSTREIGLYMSDVNIYSNRNAHNPTFTKTEIETNADLEPKLFQFKKYDITYMQSKFNAYFDMMQNDDFHMYGQFGLNYATKRFDFYLKSGKYNNFENTGATITNIGDYSIAQNLDQWKNYVLQKKVSSSAGYAYTMAGASGLLSVTGNLLVGNAFGAIASGAGTIANVVNTYAQRADLKQAPDSVASRGSNIFNDINKLENSTLTATEVDPTIAEQEIIIKKLQQTGYLLNKYKNIKDIIDTRTNFNYVETLNDDTFLIDTPVSDIQNEITRLFNKGIRFYKSINLINNKQQLNVERSISN